jgi:hypothetical protein
VHFLVGLAKRIAMKIHYRLTHPIAHQMIVLIQGSGRNFATKVGDSWQPDVAQFLLEMVPQALDLGLDLSDIAPLVGEEDFYWEDEFFDEDDLE